MITQLLKLGALIATGKFLKPRLKGLLWVAAVWVILWFVHSEYERYVELSEDRSYVLYASLIKLALYALSIAVYVWLVERKLWPKAVKVPAGTKEQATSPARQTDSKPVTVSAEDDGFDFLRNKKKLRKPDKQLTDKNP